MHNVLTSELSRFSWVLAISAIIGFLVGHPFKVLCVGFLLYYCWILRNLSKLERFIVNCRRKPGTQYIEGNGVWPILLNGIQRLIHKHRKEKRRLQAMITRIRETTSAFTDGVIVLDSRGNIEWWNQVAERLLDLHRNDQGHPFTHLVRQPKFVRYYESEDYRDPLVLKWIRRESQKLQFQITLFGQGERLIVVRDVTHIHKLEAMRKDFVANVSHELSTPLTVIQGYLETLSDHGLAIDNQDKMIRTMLQQSHRMTALIQDLIQLSKLETTDPEQDQSYIRLFPLLSRIRDEGLSIAEPTQHSIHLTCPPELYLLGNEKELHSAFSNLLTNAIKYSKPGSHIRMRAGADSQSAHFSVEDSSQGIEEKHLSRLTERFYRVDSSRSIASGGTGLGLAIVKHVLIRHNGELKIESVLNKGSIFTCVFPSGRSLLDPSLSCEIDSGQL